MAKVRVFQDAREKKRLGDERCPWSVEWRENGRRRSKTVGTAKDAGKFATLKRAALLDRGMGLIERKRWEEFKEEYLQVKVATMRSAESRVLVAQVLRTFADTAKPQWVEGIDAKTLDQYAAKRLSMPGKQQGVKLSPETVKKELRIVRAALNVAKGWKYTREVPPLPKVLGHVADKGFVTEADFGKIMDACESAGEEGGVAIKYPDPRIHQLPVPPGEWWRALLTYLWATGCRIGAALALRWEDVDLDAGTAWSRAHANKGKRDMRHSIGGIVGLLHSIRGTDPRVFPWNHSERLLWRAFESLQQAAGINRPCRLKPGNPAHECGDCCHLYGFHDFRRAHATYNYGRVPDRALQQQMGHASFLTTQSYVKYAQLHQADAYPAYLPKFLEETTDTRHPATAGRVGPERLENAETKSGKLSHLSVVVA